MDLDVMCRLLLTRVVVVVVVVEIIHSHQKKTWIVLLSSKPQKKNILTLTLDNIKMMLTFVGFASSLPLLQSCRWLVELEFLVMEEDSRTIGCCCDDASHFAAPPIVE
jgi:hypothetical protein